MDAITPGRNTVVVLNDFLGRVIQPYWESFRDPKDWGAACTFENTVSTKGIGVRLTEDWRTPHEVFEKNSAGQLNGAAVEVPTDTLLTYHLKQNPGTGIAYTGGDAQSLPLYQRFVSASGSWADDLSTDRAAFPGPVVASFSPMYRVLKTVDPHLPSTALHLTFACPGSLFSTLGPMVSIYFSGVPGDSTSTNPGLGYYCLVLDGQGWAVLHEKLTDKTWVKRDEFLYAPNMKAGELTTLTIASDAYQNKDGDWVGKGIVFGTRSVGSLGESFIQQLLEYLVSRQHYRTYKIPAPGLLTTPEKVRIDARQDARLAFSVAEARYPALGTFTDGRLQIPFPPTTAKKLSLLWYGNRPTSTTVTAEITWHDFAIPVTSSGTVTTDDARGQIIEFDIPSPDLNADGNMVYPQTFSIKFTLATSDPAVSPTIYNYMVSRDAVVDTSVVSSTTVADGTRVKKLPTFFPEGQISIQSPTEDPSVESATVTIADMKGAHLWTRWRTGTPLTILMQDSLGATYSRLFRGIIGQAQPEIIGKDGLTYPNQDGHLTTYNVQGEWAKIQRRMAPDRMSLYDDTGTERLPMKATDAIYFLLETCGYTSGQIDVPDLPIRMFGTSGDNDSALVIEPSTLFGDMIKQIAEDYLGARVIWDCNAGADGMWRLIQRKTPPYNYLMRFHIDHPGAKKAAHRLESYPSITLGSGQIQVGNYIYGGTESFSYEPPEGNLVQVFGFGVDSAQTGTGHPVKVTSFAFNPESYNFLGLSSGDPLYPDPESPDFLGECVQIQVWDPTLGTQAAADWICRRIYDVACFGREYMRFRAPLRFVVDITDAHQTYPRPLRFGDPVEIEQRDGSYRTYLCTKCNPVYSQDGFQEAEYEFVTTTNIDTVGMLPSSYDLHSLTRSRIRAAKRAMGQVAKDNPTRTNGRAYSITAGVIVGYPHVVGGYKPIQDMDTASPTFGEFFPMTGY